MARFASIRLSGFAAWFLWCVAHIDFLVGSRNRPVVGMNRARNDIIFQHGIRLITGPMDGIEVPGPAVETAPADVQLPSRSA